MSVTVTMETVMPFAMLMPKRQDGLYFCPPLGLFVFAVGPPSHLISENADI